MKEKFEIVMPDFNEIACAILEAFVKGRFKPIESIADEFLKDLFLKGVSLGQYYSFDEVWKMINKNTFSKLNGKKKKRKIL